MSPNRQRPFANAFTKGFWNTVRRSRNQVLYFVPPFILAYSAMEWAIHRCVADMSYIWGGGRDDAGSGWVGEGAR
jgi:hypothetical protein